MEPQAAASTATKTATKKSKKEPASAPEQVAHEQYHPVSAMLVAGKIDGTRMEMRGKLMSGASKTKTKTNSFSFSFLLFNGPYG